MQVIAVGDHFRRCTVVRPLDSNQKLIILSPEIVKSTEVASQSERAKVDPRSSDCAYQKGSIDTSIR